MKDNMMHMQRVDFVEIKANSTQTFKSGSYHIMLMGIKDQLKAKDEVTITLNLDNGKTMNFNAIVTDFNTNKINDSMPNHH